MIVNRDDVDLSGADLDANPYQTNADLFERHGEATSTLDVLNAWSAKNPSTSSIAK